MDLYLIIALSFASSNWLAGDLSVLGTRLELHRGAAWIAARWLGLGIVGTSLLIGTEARAAGTAGLWVPLIGALVLLVGTARKRTPPINLKDSAPADRASGAR